MRQIQKSSLMLAALILAGCGGGGSDVPAKPKFTAQVSFGDSLSDVGSYNVGLVAGLGGGQFTINAASSVKAITPTNWTEMTAKSLGLPMPCAAQTGLDNGTAAPGTPLGTSIPVVNHAGCYNYAQGGARVTNPVGINNKLVPVVAPTPTGFLLTVPVVTQMNNHLTAIGGTYSGTESVTVMAGANDVFTQLGLVGAAAITPASAVAAMATAATELVADINTLVLAKGAKYVTVINVPDIASTPQAAAYPAATKGLLDTMVTTFNSVLKAGVAGNANVLFVDAYIASKDEVANPAKYNLGNVTATACNLAAPSNPLASSLVCNAGNLSTAVPNTYLFADNVHPTPYGHLLFATYVLNNMTNKGWY